MKLLVFLILLLNNICFSQQYKYYEIIKNEIENNCNFIKKEFDLQNKCKIQMSAVIISINTTPFHKILDSLSLLPGLEKENSFTKANLFDLNNYKPNHNNFFLKKLNGNKPEKPNIRLYCSDKIHNLVTCEAVEINENDENNELMFGKSILYLFVLDKSNKIKWYRTTIIDKN